MWKDPRRAAGRDRPLGHNSGLGTGIPTAECGGIRGQIIGRDITDDDYWIKYYRRDGAMLVEDLGNRRTGRWTIEHDMLCTANDRAARLRCWQVWLSGSEVSMRERPQDQTPPAFLRRHEGR